MYRIGHDFVHISFIYSKFNSTLPDTCRKNHVSVSRVSRKSLGLQSAEAVHIMLYVAQDEKLNFLLFTP